jgi:hypothetical protein
MLKTIPLADLGHFLEYGSFYYISADLILKSSGVQMLLLIINCQWDKNIQAFVLIDEMFVCLPTIRLLSFSSIENDDTWAYPNTLLKENADRPNAQNPF